MLWPYLLAVVLLGIVVAALLGRWEGAAVPGEESDLHGSDVDDLLRRSADRRITAADLQEVRLDSAVRGYRMDQVDRLLDALGEQLDELDQAQPQDLRSAPRTAPGTHEDRSETFIEPDIDTSIPTTGTPDQHLSRPSQDHSKPRFPRVE